jgi:hypothetical protein
MSTMRKRSAVTSSPDKLVNLRRMRREPNCPFVTGEESRTLAHPLVAAPNPAHCGSMSDALSCALRCVGLIRFCGPGAPRTALLPIIVGSVATSTKSAALSFVSCAKPLVNRRTKLNSPFVVMPPAGARPLPSR